MPTDVQISVSDDTPAGRALAISGQSALSAMAKIASQEAKRSDFCFRNIGRDDIAEGRAVQSARDIRPRHPPARSDVQIHKRGTLRSAKQPDFQSRS